MASKTAIDAFSESLSREVKPYNIHVLVLVPGYFPTNFFTEPRAAERATTVYTDPAQGYKVREGVPQDKAVGGRVGDLG